MKFVQKIFYRIKHVGFLRTCWYLLGTCFLEKIGIHIVRTYQLSNDVNKTKLQIALLNWDKEFAFGNLLTLEDFTVNDRTALNDYDPALLQESGFPAWLIKGMDCTIARNQEKILACLCWGIKTEHRIFPKELQACYLIQRCNTLPLFRGRGTYPATLIWTSFCIRSKYPDLPILIESSVFNHSSIRGIEKAMFRQLGYRLSFTMKFFQKTYYWRSPK